MSSTVSSSFNFQSIFDAALADYLDKTGIDLIKDSFSEKLQNCQTADDILELLQDKASQFKDYRSGNRKLINCLNPAVQVLHAFSGILGGVASLVSALFSSISSLFYAPAPRSRSNQQMSYFLASIFFSAFVFPLLSLTISSSGSCPPIQAAIAVGTSYDALVDLFECVANFLGRLHIYTETPFTPTISHVLIAILSEVLSVLSLATKQIKQGRFSKLLIGHIYIIVIAELGAEKFAKKLLGESEIEAVIQRLDRLTDDEARMTVAQTLQVVYGLVNNVKVVMDGMQASIVCCQLLTRIV